MTAGPARLPSLAPAQTEPRRFGMISEVDLDDGTRLVEIETGRLKVRKASYQRILRPERVKWLVDHWDQRLAEPLSISFENGEHWVVLGIRTCYAVVHYGLSKRDEARLFGALATQRWGLTPIEIYRSQIVGEIERSLRVKASLDQVGLHVGQGGEKGSNTVSAVSALWEIERSGLLDAVLSVIIDAWRGQDGNTAKYALHHRTLRAVTGFLRAHGQDPTYSRDRLVLALSRHAPLELLREAHSSAPTVSAELIAVVTRWYNLRLSAKLQLPSA